MPTTYRIHPAIGIARLGNSPDAFCISPEKPAALPIDCDAQGNARLGLDGSAEQTITTFKDADGRIKRQAARFQIYVYDDESPEGRPLKIGDRISGGGNDGVLQDIQWRVYLANKKASWYQFSQLEGEHGYAPRHPRRNSTITAPEARQRLIIDPGPRIVDLNMRRSARFDREGAQEIYAPTFPPPLKPHSIDTLGELKTDDAGRLLVLGGHGHSGSFQYDDFGQPRIDEYANNDGWFDDTSDGPVMARLVMFSELVGRERFIDVEYPAWCIVGYPAYVPEILDMVTLDDVLEDLSIQQFETRPDIFSEKTGWNPDYKPWFWRDIWPILFRPDQFSYLTNILGQSNYPHNESKRGNFDPTKLSVPPVVRNGVIVEDPNRANRQYLFDLLRAAGQDNQFAVEGPVTTRIYGLPLMPLLAGDNPISNTLPSKFLRLTDYQYFILKQWARGFFYNEEREGWLTTKPDPFNPYAGWVNRTGHDLDRGVLSNLLGGAFCPGGEVGWIIRNRAIYKDPYRIKADPSFYTFEETAAQANAWSGSLPDSDYVSYTSDDLSQDDDFDTGMQPGDLTKHSALPWQADFNECSTQDIDVTYEGWNQIFPQNNGDSLMVREQRIWETLWWPAHRPLQTFEVVSMSGRQPTGYRWVDWSRGVPQTNAGDLKMVTEWPRLGFVRKNPFAQGYPDVLPTELPPPDPPPYISVERENKEKEHS
jgi:hypothetical protein